MKQHRNILKSIFGFFTQKAQNKTYTSLQEIGTFKSIFGMFGKDIYNNIDVRACVRALSEHTSKANPRCTDKRIERLLSIRPNVYMNGKDMLSKLRNYYEIKNNAFLFIQRGEDGRPIGFYPVPYAEFQPLTLGEGSDKDLFIQFFFNGTATNSYVLPWDDLVAIRKDYIFSDIAGESNEALLPTLETCKTIDEGIQNAIKSTANLRGILKSLKAMLSPDDIKKQKDQFVADYMNINNTGGIASLDATQEFQPIEMKPTTASADETKDYRDRIFTYFGVTENFVKSKYTETDYDAIYEAKIEPFLVCLSLELTGKIFTDREISFGNRVYYESNRLQFASIKTKLSLVALVDRGLMTPNEFREVLNLAPYEGGDEFVLRLDTAKTGDTTNEGTGNPVGRPPKEEGEENDS